MTTAPLSAAIAADLPFTVATADDGGVTVTLLLEAGLHPRITHADSYTWIRGLSGALVIDVGQLRGLNSLVIAWLFQLIQTGRPTALEVVAASEQIVTQLRHFHIDDFVRVSTRVVAEPTAGVA